MKALSPGDLLKVRVVDFWNVSAKESERGYFVGEEMHENTVQDDGFRMLCLFEEICVYKYRTSNYFYFHLVGEKRRFWSTTHPVTLRPRARCAGLSFPIPAATS